MLLCTKYKNMCSDSILLEHIDALMVDCQTTGATPKTGHLLEIAWCSRSAHGDEENVKTYLVTLPKGENISPQVGRITGICQTDLDAALTFEEVSRLFRAELKKRSNNGIATIVAHYARFEQRFVAHLLGGCPTSVPTLDYICTYELSRRLMPDLPKHTLRAVSGFLGHQLPEKRRAGDHVLATATVWAGLINILRQKEKVFTLAELKQYLSNPPPKPPKKKRYMIGKHQREGLPAKPGVYRFLDRNGAELYIGKATSLKQRVNSYFTHAAGKASHILEMLSGAHEVAYTPTATALEAALLEVDAIKQHNPPYNRSLRTEHPQLLFYSPGFERSSDAPHPGFPLGPFPNQTIAQGLTALTSLLENLDNPRTQWSEPGRALFELFDEGPDDATLLQGMTLFSRCFLSSTQQSISTDRLIALGMAMNQQERQATDEENHIEEVARDEEDPIAAPVWHPGRVLRYCTHITRAAARHWQRAVWYRMLGNAVLTWMPATREGPASLRLLRLRQCTIVDAGDVDPEAGVEPVSFLGTADGPKDRTAYDRMRVLTTELKRLVASGRAVVTYIYGIDPLSGERLASFLRGV